MLNTTTALAALAGCALVATASAGTIVQDGSLSGGLGTTIHMIDLDRFDTQGGTRTLDAVQLEFLTAVIGGGETTPGGPDVAIFAQISADYALGATPLAQTEATIDQVISQAGPAIAFTVFDNDTAAVTVDQPADLVPWTGAGLITLTGRVTFEISEDPSGGVGFGAGGSIQYTVTYEFTGNDPCAADLDGDANVGFTDLNALLAVWGACPGCPEDLDGDANVGFTDLNALLAAWGSCG